MVYWVSPVYAVGCAPVAGAPTYPRHRVRTPVRGGAKGVESGAKFLTFRDKTPGLCNCLES